MKVSEYKELKRKLIARGYGNEIKWAEEIRPCQTPIAFFEAFGWVIVNSGMKNQIASIIWDRIINAIKDHRFISSAFGHKGKVAALDYVLDNRIRLYQKFKDAEDKLSFLQSLPWIGPITKYHLAKNLGLDFMKPDRHLVRVAKIYNTTPVKLCTKLSIATGDRIGVVDLVIWRCCNLEIIKTKVSHETKDKKCR